MIIVDRPKLKFLLAGRVITVESGRGDYRKDRTYAAGASHNKGICRVQVLTITKADGGFELEIRQVARDVPRLLAARPGPGRDYVSDPHLAMRDDPEAVDTQTQKKMAEQGTFRWRQEHALRDAQRLSAHLHERLARLEREQRRVGAPDVSAELRVIRERLRKLRSDAA